jgi:microcystin-dependent protein
MEWGGIIMSRIDINTNITNVVKKYLTSFSKSLVSRFYNKSEIDKKMANIDSRSLVGSELDYLYCKLSVDAAFTVGQNIPFVQSGDSKGLSINNGIVTLKAGKTYAITMGLYDSLGAWKFIYNLTDSKELGNRSDYIRTTESFAIIKCAKDTQITARVDRTTNVCVSSASFLQVIEMARTEVMDPAQQIDKDTGIQDTPVGHIMSVMGLKTPPHYLACDGKTYNIVDYQKLANYFLTEFGSINYFGGDGVTTFAVPDMRGEFVRGYDPTNLRDPQGSTRGIGKHQDGTEQTSVSYCMNNNAPYLQFRADNDGSFTSPTKPDSYKKTKYYANIYSSIPATQYTVDLLSTYTARPTNVNVLYCIKFEPTYFMNYSPQYAGFESKTLYDSFCGKTGAYELKDSITNYDMLIFCTTNSSDANNIINSDNHVVHCSDIIINHNREIYGYDVRYLNYKFLNDTCIYLNVVSDVYLYKIIGLKSGSMNVEAFSITDAETDNGVADIWNEVGM